MAARPHVARVLAAALLLSGCSGWLGEDEEEPIEGERVSILAQVGVPPVDERIADLPVALPALTANRGWPQQGGGPSHAMGHLDAPGDLVALWRRTVGAGSSDSSRILAQPVVADGRVYTIDAEAVVGAFDIDSGEPLWRVSLVRDEDDRDGILGGGVAVDGGRVFATTGFSHVIALSTEDGSELWRRVLSAPVRGGPTVFGDRVFVVTVADETFAFDAGSGRALWDHGGLSEIARLVGGAPPAADAGVVVAPHSSGEIAALRVENGRVVWTESLAGVRRSAAVATLAHIRGWPVIDRGVVYAVSHGNRTIAVDLRTGSRLWSSPIGGVHGPWPAGDFVFVMTGDAALVCLTRRDGRVRWVKQLPRYLDEEDLEDPVLWTGPVLAGGRLIVASSESELLSLSPGDGEVTGRVPLPGPVLITPAVAAGTLLVLTEGADLIAFR